MTPALRVKALGVQLPGGVRALNDVSFEVPRGTICALVGPNGAGKSTLLRTMLGLERPTCGSCEILGASFQPGKTPVAYIPQRNDIDLDFPVTVADVVAMGFPSSARILPSLSLARRNERRAGIRSLLALVGLSDLAERPLSDLSGGQRQRTFFARALAQAPEVFLLDEPFSGVDYETERWLVDHLRVLTRSGKTAFIVHHDVTSVQRIFEHVVLLNVGVFGAGRVDEMWSEQALRRTFHPDAHPEGI